MMSGPPSGAPPPPPPTGPPGPPGPVPSPGPAQPPPPARAARWPLVVAGTAALLLLVAVAVVALRTVGAGGGSDQPPIDDFPPEASPGSEAGVDAASIPVDGDLATVRVDALLPDEHNERGRALLTDQDLVVLSHPEYGQRVTVSLLRAAAGALTVVDRRELECSYDEDIIGDAGGASLRDGDGVAYALCFGFINTVLDPEASRVTQVWILEPDTASLRVHPDHVRGWPTVGFHLGGDDGGGDDGGELLLTVCTDVECDVDRYTYAVHVARDPASGAFEVVACSEPDGPRTEVPGGPWDASDNPTLTPPDPERGCGAPPSAQAEPTTADVAPIVTELCRWLDELAVSQTDEQMLEAITEIDELRFHALAVGVLSPDELHAQVGDTCPQRRSLWEEFLEGIGYA